MKKVRLMEAIIFFIGWNCLFLLGADFPPPRGFIWLVVATGVLAVIQDYYLRFLFPRINQPRIFLYNEFLFGCAGIVVALVFALPHQQTGNSLLTWILIITLVALLYGTVFFVFNKWLVKHHLMK
ncbi:hypothetical protein [Limosilactobacillus kribbianus]|uniref:hypothetical protein n=1 Tax=Limosilactobacillus kribbianus TaxID=2982695 RepID=UPI002264459D|nr:hypothetical protein [Limosilactobacillus kribbianus]